MAGNGKDNLGWDAAAESLKGSHWEEMKNMGRDYRNTLVRLGGETLTVGQVAAVATAKRGTVVVQLNEAVREGVDASSEWVMESMYRGTDSYGVTTGFGSTSHRRTTQGGALQTELIRWFSIFYLLLVTIHKPFSQILNEFSDSYIL